MDQLCAGRGNTHREPVGVRETADPTNRHTTIPRTPRKDSTETAESRDWDWEPNHQYGEGHKDPTGSGGTAGTTHRNATYPAQPHPYLPPTQLRTYRGFNWPSEWTVRHTDHLKDDQQMARHWTTGPWNSPRYMDRGPDRLPNRRPRGQPDYVNTHDRATHSSPPKSTSPSLSNLIYTETQMGRGYQPGRHRQIPSIMGPRTLQR